MPADSESQRVPHSYPLNDLREIFDALDLNQDQHICANDLWRMLEENGLDQEDPRVSGIYKKIEDDIKEKVEEQIDFDSFCKLIENHEAIIFKVITGDLVIPDFKSFTQEIEDIYDQTRYIEEGEVANYIPELAQISPHKYAISICTLDGQQFSLGDYQDFFSLQSTAKPMNYCLALENYGEDYVHCHVGREPSGHTFNEITLDSLKRPHNPLINAGAIMTSSMIKPGLSSSLRFDYILEMWEKVCGGKRPNFNNSVYLSEKTTADRNFSLAYFMRENDSFPDKTDLLETLDFYFQCCSIEATTQMMSVAAATLAAGGVNPLTGVRVFQPDTVKNCLSLMSSCGMYDFSGEFAFTVGLPAKSGVGGGLMLVIPNLMGITIWSPPLDHTGNSVRGIEFCQRLVDRFNFHMYDSLIDNKNKKLDPRKRKNLSLENGTMALCWAAAKGDLDEVIHLISSGADYNRGDYDGRTPLHLAAAENQVHIVEYLLSKNCEKNMKDRWGFTPLDDAKRSQANEIVKLLSD